MRLTPAAYLQIVAATNYKQRVRKMIEYYHADRLNYAVAGTPNRLEYDQGFFVKQGDGAADVKPIAHLYKTQVYQLAAHLGVPEEIRRRPPTTDTFSMPQTQEEFYFALPYDRMDLCLYALNHGIAAAEVAPLVELTPEQVERVFKDIDAKRRATRYLHAASRRPARGCMCGIAGIVSLGAAPAPRREALLRMAGALAHRGPDELGLYRDAARGPRARAPVDHRPRHRPAADGRRDAHARGSSSTARSSTTSSCAPSSMALGHRFRTRSDTEVIVHAWRRLGRARLRALQRPVGGRALGLGGAAPGARARPTRRRPLYLCEHGGRCYFASEVKAIFAADAVDPARLRSRRHRADLHVLVGRAAAVGVPGHRGAAARATCASTSTGRVQRRTRSATPRYRRLRAARWTTRSRACASAARSGDARCACCAPTCRSAATSPAASTARYVAALGREYAGERFQTFSLRFEDAEYDETAYQRLMAQRLGAEHHEVVVSRGDIARRLPARDRAHRAPDPAHRAGAAVPAVAGWCAATASRWCSPAKAPTRCSPATTCSARARCAASGRASPARRGARALLERLYPYLARSPVAQQAMARQFFGRNLAAHRDAGLRARHALADHRRAQAAVRRPPCARGRRPGRASCSPTLPARFARWTPLAQDQYLEMRTLLSGYLLSSQGDRMLMAHSVEGRFPFLDSERDRARGLAAGLATSCACSTRSTC